MVMWFVTSRGRFCFAFFFFFFVFSHMGSVRTNYKEKQASLISFARRKRQVAYKRKSVHLLTVHVVLLISGVGGGGGVSFVLFGRFVVL